MDNAGQLALGFLGEQPRGRPSQPPSGSDDAHVHHRVSCSQTLPLSTSRDQNSDTPTSKLNKSFFNTFRKPLRRWEGRNWRAQGG